MTFWLRKTIPGKADTMSRRDPGDFGKRSSGGEETGHVPGKGVVWSTNSHHHHSGSACRDSHGVRHRSRKELNSSRATLAPCAVDLELDLTFDHELDLVPRVVMRGRAFSIGAPVLDDLDLPFAGRPNPDLIVRVLDQARG